MSYSDLTSTGTTRTSCLNYFSDQNSHLLQHAEGSSSMSGNPPILGVSSSYLHHSSAFQPFFSSPCPYIWPLLDRYASCDSLSVRPDQRRRNQFTDSPGSQDAFELESLSDRTQTSTALEDVQSVIEAGISGKGKSKSAREKLSSTNSDCSYSDTPDSEIKHDSKLRRKKKPVEVKDDRYWKRREKNNLAAKKSRDARRRQELSTQQRATFLEIENTRLRLELSCLRQENRKLKRFLDIYVGE